MSCRLKPFAQSSSDLLTISYSILFDEQQLAPPDGGSLATGHLLLTSRSLSHDTKLCL